MQANSQSPRIQHSQALPIPLSHHRERHRTRVVLCLRRYTVWAWGTRGSGARQPAASPLGRRHPSRTRQIAPAGATETDVDCCGERLPRKTVQAVSRPHGPKDWADAIHFGGVCHAAHFCVLLTASESAAHLFGAIEGSIGCRNRPGGALMLRLPGTPVY
ncbi:hypothetical protein NDU88_004423 [Pleurodeles waltl]|uniref:Uncharacterized protein n=1 Tax=Pleurodeles waltl TaxID=8319 RepID=A0AAV7KXU5_PLEWA|nr:hypothetical protein NDU88_004423 [Pleurodeles waltl]